MFIQQQQRTAAYEYFCGKKMKQYCNNPETDLNFTRAYIEPSLLFANSKIFNLGSVAIPQVTLLSGDPEQSVQFTVKYIINFKIY